MRSFRYLTVALAGLVLLVAPITAALAAVMQSTTEPAARLSIFATAAIGFAATFAWGRAKKGIAFTNAKVFGLDTKAVAFMKPVQPFVVAGLAIALPLLGNKLGITDLPPADVEAIPF